MTSVAWGRSNTSPTVLGPRQAFIIGRTAQQYPADVLDLDARLEFTLIRIEQITPLSQQNWLAPEPRQVRRFTGRDPISSRGPHVDFCIAAFFRLTPEELIAEERYDRG